MEVMRITLCDVNVYGIINTNDQEDENQDFPVDPDELSSLAHSCVQKPGAPFWQKPGSATKSIGSTYSKSSSATFINLVRNPLEPEAITGPFSVMCTIVTMIIA
ncbi:hypothetical protein L2E82_22047 [Cichorium intybus]|uniref:Uncharacterized protein n=1 Tax=Cichorium intybus TaxID=13427 RepID=A0ACB9DX57_CICIN|nr:hypothetical protein L2E82_22047 [Cichorium intybus]